MTTTEVRPAPTPPRMFGTAGQRPPEGAAGMAKLWVDADGLPQSSPHPVPVDADGRRTPHLRYSCRGEIELDGVRQNCDQVQWLLPDSPERFCPDHGKPLVADEKAPAAGFPWGQVWQASKHRAAVAGVTAAAGAAGVAVDLADMPWWADLTQVTAMPAAIAGSWWLTRQWLVRRDIKRGRLDPADEVAGKRRRRLAARRARTAAYTATAAAGWVAATDVLDVFTAPGSSALWLAGLGAAAAVASRPYLAWVDSSRKAKPAEQQPTPTPVQVVETMPPGDIAAAKWVRHNPKGTIPDTVLLPDTWRKVIGGWGIIIHATKPGAIAADMFDDQSAKSRLRAIAGTFEVNRKFFNFVEQDNPNDVLMLCQPKPPLADGKVWLGPGSIDVDKGVAHSGFFIDGTDMWEPFYKYGWGAPSKMVVGTTGSGKSENLRKQLVIERYFAVSDPAAPGGMRGLFASFLQDFKRFESYGEFRRAVHASGCTVDDAYLMRDALIREMDRRYDMLASHVWFDKKGRRREGGIHWDPRVHGPILSWIIDEFHEIAKDTAFIAPLELLARKMRACGIRITIGTHMGTLGDTGSRGLRDMLAGGYLLLGRTTDSLTTAVTGAKLTADPRQLPKLAGMCLVADGEQQTMHARQTYIPSNEDEPLNVYDLLYDDNNQPIGYPAVLPPETLEAFGPEWVEWAEAGKEPGGRKAGPWNATSATQAAAPVGEPSAEEATSAKEAVAQILASNGGEMDIDAIDAALEPFRARGVRCSISMARKVLAVLVKDEFAVKTRHGFYQISEAAEDLFAQLADTREDDA